MSTDPDWKKVTVYMKESTRVEAMQKVVREKTTLSGTVDALLAAWAAGLIDVPMPPA